MGAGVCCQQEVDICCNADVKKGEKDCSNNQEEDDQYAQKPTRKPFFHGGNSMYDESTNKDE